MAPSAGAEAPAYQAQVLPVLAQNCYKCHGPEERKGGLRLSSEEDARKGGDSGHSPFEPGAGGEIPLLQRITTSDEALQMPPNGPRLSKADIETLTAWVKAGAPWHGAAGDPEVFWSFRKPVQPSLPANTQLEWGRNPIDAFTLQAMTAHGLTPSPEADRNALIRRLSLDLRGLPPTPEEIRAYVADTRPDAYERLVEQFLSSPHYGERMAIAWLDVARYADTNGYEKDRPRSIWPYRDWVIGAYQADMPFDRFVIEQIAGDLLPSPTLDQRIATGFHRNVMLNEEGGIDVEEFRFKNVVDRTNTTATALLGLTMGCAQCHTHKYDPISQQEYYEFFAFFNNTDDLTLDVPQPDITATREQQRSRIAELRSALRGQFPTHDPQPVRVVLAPAAAEATDGGALPVLDGSAVDVSKAAPESNTYIVQTVLGPGRVDGLTLHVFTGENGPGRTPHGNFVLSEILAYRLDGDTRTNLILNRAESAFSQENYPVEQAIDGRLDTGWGVAGDPKGMKQDREATFYFAEPLELDAVQPIEVRLEQQLGNQHTLGNFRLESVRVDTPEAGIPEGQLRERFLAKRFSAWAEAIRQKSSPWQPLNPVSMETHKYTTLVRLEDNSILATGDLPNNDIYDLALRTGEEQVTGIRLEVLPHESLPGGGPGRGVILSEGDFFLTGVKISAAPWSDPEAKVPVTIVGATESYADSGKTAVKALDGKTDTGWSIKGGEGKSHAAVFAFETPVGYPGGTLFFVTLEQQYIHQHTIGRFRLSATARPNPEAAGVPADIESLLLAGSVTGGEQARLEQFFLEHTPLLADAQAEIEQLEKGMPKQPTTLALEEREIPRVAHVHHRGEFMEPREAVRPDVPAVLPPLPEYAPRNRLTLARWLVGDENPLTARVTMNRLWEQVFGRGIVNTVDDFGMMGTAPTHPELLDWLAVEFMRRGWNVKDMVRLMATSATYLQSAAITPERQAIDPENLYLARSPRFRVDAELVRDIALAASGTLDESVGGPSVFPPLPEGLLDFVYGGFTWTVDTGANRHRRGMYTYWKRMLPYPTAAVFDAPARDMVCVRRIRTNTPMQALTLLNDEVFMEAARALARDLLENTPDDPAARLRALFMRCLSREPDAEEAQAMLAYLDEQQAVLAGQPAEKVQALLNVEGGDENADAQVRQAAWTLLCRAVLNLDETITRG